MAELADAADLKSAGPKGLWGFESPSRHHELHSEAQPGIPTCLIAFTSKTSRQTITVENCIVKFTRAIYRWLFIFGKVFVAHSKMESPTLARTRFFLTTSLA